VSPAGFTVIAVDNAVAGACGFCGSSPHQAALSHYPGNKQDSLDVAGHSQCEGFSAGLAGYPGACEI